MTETEWRTSAEPKLMLDSVKLSASDRKLRLFGVACCRQSKEQMNVQAAADALEAAERYADTMKTKTVLKRARQGLKSIRHAIPAEDKSRVVEWAALWLAEVVASENASAGVGDEVIRLASLQLLHPSVSASLGELLRCVFGNLLNPVLLDATSRTPALVSVVQSIYGDRAFDRMPEMANALTHAGWTNKGILEHCRGPGPHARGCWVVDLILGKQ